MPIGERVCIRTCDECTSRVVERGERERERESVIRRRGEARGMKIERDRETSRIVSLSVGNQVSGPVGQPLSISVLLRSLLLSLFTLSRRNARDFAPSRGVVPCSVLVCATRRSYLAGLSPRRACLVFYVDACVMISSAKLPRWVRGRATE